MDESEHARPSPELLVAQQRGKEAWRRLQANLPLKEKIRLLLELQRKVHPILRQRRPLRPWEHPWAIEP